MQDKIIHLYHKAWFNLGEGLVNYPFGLWRQTHSLYHIRPR